MHRPPTSHARSSTAQVVGFSSESRPHEPNRPPCVGALHQPPTRLPARTLRQRDAALHGGLRRAQVLTLLTEGVGINFVVRITGIAKTTILRLLAEAGHFSSVYQSFRFRDRLRCERIEADEIWSFVGAKRKRKNARQPGHGDLWTFTAIDPDTKLMAAARHAHAPVWKAHELGDGRGTGGSDLDDAQRGRTDGRRAPDRGLGRMAPRCPPSATV